MNYNESLAKAIKNLGGDLVPVSHDIRLIVVGVQSDAVKDGTKEK